MTITSPPYDDLRNYNGNISQWSEIKWKAIIFDLFRVTKKGGVVVWIVGDATTNGSESGTSFKQALWAKECGFHLHDTMIWNKGCFSAVGSLQTRYAPVFEYMFIFSNDRPKTFNPIKDRKNLNFGRKVNGSVRNKDGSMKSFSKEVTINEYGQRFNVWEQYPHRQIGGHPAPFQEQLINDHIISWSNVGDVIFDPMMGSGTTAVACINTKRNFIGIELDEIYFNLAKDRIKESITKRKW